MPPTKYYKKDGITVTAGCVMTEVGLTQMPARNRCERWASSSLPASWLFRPREDKGMAVYAATQEWLEMGK